jgi:hypothetical protein
VFLPKKMKPLGSSPGGFVLLTPSFEENREHSGFTIGKYPDESAVGCQRYALPVAIDQMAQQFASDRDGRGRIDAGIVSHRRFGRLIFWNAGAGHAAPPAPVMGAVVVGDDGIEPPTSSV